MHWREGEAAAECTAATWIVLPNFSAEASSLSIRERQSEAACTCRAAAAQL